jgi:N-hydroxyarylamine O-acetyltransferase
MTGSIDLDAYFDRVGWSAGASPTFTTLSGLLDSHVSRIPFENLDVLLGRRVRLDVEGLKDKLLRAHRGGYCFEHATLLAAVLEKLGFRLARHSARVILETPATVAPRDHMFLTVVLPEGTFVVDPGFGSMSSRIPIPLREGAQVRRGEETHWMIRDGGLWVLRMQRGAKSVNAWASTLEHDNAADFEMSNYFTATHPTSLFVNQIVINAFTPDGRIGVSNRDVTIVRNGRYQKAQLADRKGLRGVLKEHLGFDLPELEGIRVPAIPEWR